MFCSSGMIGLTENPDALRKWMLAGPELASLVSHFEAVFRFGSENEEKDHQSVSALAHKNFNRDVRNMMSVFEEAGSPFQEDTADLICVDTRRVASAEVVKTHDHSDVRFKTIPRFCWRTIGESFDSYQRSN